MTELDIKYQDMINLAQRLSKEIVYLFHRINGIHIRVNSLIELMEFVTREKMPHGIINRDINDHVIRMNKDLDEIGNSINECASVYGALFIEECAKIVIRSDYNSKFEEFYYYANLLMSDCSNCGRFVKKSKKLEEENKTINQYIFEANYSNVEIQKKFRDTMKRASECITMLINTLVIPIGATTFAQLEE